MVDRVKSEFKPFFDSMKDLMLKNNEMVGECQLEMKKGDDETKRVINGVELQQKVLKQVSEHHEA